MNTPTKTQRVNTGVSRSFASALAFVILFQIFVFPGRSRANPVVVGAISYIAHFLADYAAGKILDEVLFDRPHRRRSEARFAEMNRRYRKLQEHLEELDELASINRERIASLRDRMEAIERRGALNDHLFIEATSALSRLQREWAAREGAPDSFLMTLPDEVESILAHSDRRRAGQFARKLESLLPQLEQREPLGRFLDESLLFAKRTKDRLDRIFQELESQGQAIKDLKRFDSIILVELEELADDIRRSHEPPPDSALLVHKDYRSITGVRVFQQLQRAVGAYCPVVAVLGSRPYPAEAFSVQLGLTYSLHCFIRELGDDFRQCDLTVNVVDLRSTVVLDRKEAVFGKNWRSIDSNLDDLITRLVQEDICRLVE